MVNCKITAAAKYVPELVITNDDLSKFLDTSDEWISSRTGIRERRISRGENTSDMCAAVVHSLMEKSGLNPLDIDIIIVATISPDTLTPSTACMVQMKTGAKNAFAFDVNAACSGFVYALSIGAKFMACGKYRNIVIIGAETLSKIVDWDDRSTCVLFGDGAGGVLLTASEETGVLDEDIHSDGCRFDAIIGRSLDVKNPFADPKEEGLKHIRMNGREVYDFAVKEVPDSINRLLQSHGLVISDIQYIIPHQANARIVDTFAKKLKTDLSKFYLNIDKYGNTSAASIPIALAEMLESGLLQLGSGDLIILTGFGGGLTWGSILLKI